MTPIITLPDYQLMESDVIQELVLQSFLIEVNAFKPGNVSRYSEGHDMEHHDFVKSAEVCTPTT